MGKTVFPILYTLHLESQPNPYSFDAGNYVKGHQDTTTEVLPTSPDLSATSVLSVKPLGYALPSDYIGLRAGKGPMTWPLALSTFVLTRVPELVQGGSTSTRNQRHVLGGHLQERSLVLRHQSQHYVGVQPSEEVEVQVEQVAHTGAARRSGMVR